MSSAPPAGLRKVSGFGAMVAIAEYSKGSDSMGEPAAVIGSARTIVCSEISGGATCDNVRQLPGPMGVVPMGVFGEHEADPSVAAYDRELVPWLFEHWAEPMADLVAPLPSSRIVDLACGSGLMVRHLVGRLGETGRIHGVDVDSAMLGYASTTVDDSRVAWHESDASRLPFETAGIDRVCCHQGLQFFPDRLAALGEVRRVLAPGGCVALAVWGDIEANPWPAALSTAVGRVVGDEAGDGMKVVCDLGDPAEVEALLDLAGFERIQVEVHQRTATHPDVRAAVGGQLSALPSGSAIGELGPERRAELIDLMSALLVDYVGSAGALKVPSTSTFAQATNPATSTERVWRA